MKTGAYYFAKLSEKEQGEFRENCDNFEWLINEEFESFNGFIEAAFFWRNTTQGYDYREEIANRKID